MRENEEWREIATREVCKGEKLATANLLVLMRVERGGGYHVDFHGGRSQVRAAAQEQAPSHWPCPPAGLGAVGQQAGAVRLRAEGSGLALGCLESEGRPPPAPSLHPQPRHSRHLSS